MTDGEWWHNSKHHRTRGLSRLGRCHIMKRLSIGFLLVQLAGCLSPQDRVKAYIVAHLCVFDHHVDTRTALDPHTGKVRVWKGWSIFNCPQIGEFPESHPYVYDVDGKQWRP
jgi:hypothetical protein